MQHKTNKAPFNQLEPVHSSNILVPSLFIWRGWRNSFHSRKKGKKSTLSAIKFLFTFLGWKKSGGTASHFNLPEFPANKHIAEFTEWWYLFQSSTSSMGRQTDRHGDRLFYSRACGQQLCPQRHYNESFHLDTTSTWVTKIEYSCYQC